MSALSDYMEGNLCAWFKGTAMPTAPTALYVAFFSSDPTDTGTGGTEVTGSIRTGGTRPQVTFGTVTNGSMSNSAQVVFGNSIATCTASHFGVYNAQTGGNLMFHGPLTNPISINVGDYVVIDIGALNFQCT